MSPEGSDFARVFDENKCLGSAGHCAMCKMRCANLLECKVTIGQTRASLLRLLRSEGFADFPDAESERWKQENPHMSEAIERCACCGRCTRACPCENDARNAMLAARELILGF